MLASVEWEQKFPLVSVVALTRAGSDHTPLILDSGEQAHLGNKSKFSFELAWFRLEGFIDMVKKEWLSISNGKSSMERWQNKIRHLRRYLRGWAKNLSSEYKKEKERLLNLIDSLDKQAEFTPLIKSDRDKLREANFCLAKFRREEESKWAQRAKIKHVQEGGNNMKYFHLIANGKHRRIMIFQLEQEEGTIVGHENLKVYISEFYKKLFGAPGVNNFSLLESEDRKSVV